MEARDLYNRMLHIANQFLRRARVATFEELQEFDPSAEELARHFEFVAGAIRIAAADDFEDQNVAMNAFQCSLVMAQIVKAILNHEVQEVERLLGELEARVQGP